MFAGRVILFLYQVILGRGEPVAEQLILIGSSTPDILTASGGVTVKTGGSEGEHISDPLVARTALAPKLKPITNLWLVEERIGGSYQPYRIQSNLNSARTKL